MATAITATTVAPRRRPLYIGLSLLMGLIAGVGFWPRYFGPLVQGTLVQPPVIHVHAIVFTGWLVLFFTQAVLAATGQVRWHSRLGKVGIAYGVVLIGVGLYTGVVRSSVLPLGGPAEGLLFVSLADMVLFSAFFSAAVAYRRTPRLHRPLMVVAATTLLVAAVGRLTFLPPSPFETPVGLAVWASPLLVAMASDIWNHRRPHPVYLIGLVGLVLRTWSVVLVETPAWGAVTVWVAGISAP